MITIKLLDDIKSIESKINSAIATEVNKILFQNQSKILQESKLLASRWIASQPEMLALQSSVPGSLAGQFGLYAGQGQSSVISIVNSVENSISTSFKKFNSKLIGGLEVNFQPKNFLNLLNLPQGIVNYEKGQLHWLDWLLLKGDTTIVVNYQYNPNSGIGRSGLGNMIEGGSFRVPPQFSGTSDDNFVTRALVGPEQEKRITDIFKKVLGG
jgi:hypothetical protein